MSFAAASELGGDVCSTTTSINVYTRIYEQDFILSMYVLEQPAHTARRIDYRTTVLVVRV